MAKYNVGDKVIIEERGAAGLKIGTRAKVVEVNATGVYLDALNCVGARSWYRFESVAKVPTKNQRITTLEQQVAELQAEVAALKKAQATPKFIPVTTDNIAVGDKIRVVDVSGISIATAIGFKNGIVATVVSVESGGIAVGDVVNGGIPLSISVHEFHAIEKVVSA